MKKGYFLQVFFLLLLVFYSGTEVFAREAIILVYPFKNTGSNDFSWVSAGMTDTVISDLGRVRGVHVISESDRKKALKEISLGFSGVVSDDTLTKIGKLTGANMIFTGSYLVIDNKIRVNARLIDIETAKIEKP